MSRPRHVIAAIILAAVLLSLPSFFPMRQAPVNETIIHKVMP